VGISGDTNGGFIEEKVPSSSTKSAPQERIDAIQASMTCHEKVAFHFCWNYDVRHEENADTNSTIPVPVGGSLPKPNELSFTNDS
jgi:hypothetical protein